MVSNDLAPTSDPAPGSERSPKAVKALCQSCLNDGTAAVPRILELNLVSIESYYGMTKMADSFPLPPSALYPPYPLALASVYLLSSITLRARTGRVRVQRVQSAVAQTNARVIWWLLVVFTLALVWLQHGKESVLSGWLTGIVIQHPGNGLWCAQKPPMHQPTFVLNGKSPSSSFIHAFA